MRWQTGSGQVVTTEQLLIAYATLNPTSHSDCDGLFQDFGPGNTKKCEEIGRLFAERALAKGIVRVAFDRSGYQYHGCVKVLAESARANGLEF